MKTYLINSTSETSKISDKCVLEVSKDLTKSIYYRIGYMLYGSLLLSYCNWIHEYCIRNSIECVMFLARDGYSIKKAWTNIFNDIDSKYLYASRSSVLETRIRDDISVSNLINNITDKKSISVKGIIDAFRLPEKETKDLRIKFGISNGLMIFPDRYYKDSDVREYFEELLSLVKNNIEERSRLFEEYIRKNFETYSRVAVVDIGWRGTIQEGIETAAKYLGIETEIHGLYLGVYGKGQGRRNIQNARGYLYNAEDKERLKKLKTFRGLAEFFFSAPHGKVIGYEKTNGSIIPILEEYEYRRDFGAGSIEEQALMEMQDGAIDYVSDMKRIKDLVAMTRDEAMMPLYSFSIDADLSDIEILGDLHFYSDTMEMIAKPKSIDYYLYDHAELKKDFAKSVWKIGFMKRLLHNIPFPYVQAYNFLLKRYGVI